MRACSGPISICACSVSVSVGWCFQGCLCLSCLCPSVAKSVCTCGCLHMCAVDEDLLVCPVLSWAHLCRACIHVHTPALGTGVPWCARSRRVLMLPCAKSAPRPFDSEQILLLMLCLSPGLDIRSHVTKSTSKGDDGGYASPGGGGREASKPGSSWRGRSLTGVRPVSEDKWVAASRGQPATRLSARALQLRPGPVVRRACGEFGSARKR